ncbi:FUSC family protein [Arthrobacter sp. H35-D1]|uniref:FUSC family protein n=1 Tax=Arthrobacter sp. H35-D1 TaxID=3046202 RepID=UPI0024BAB002|nr:FUSC family protein [Arthrobacter sp. H35-D1]MDJ0315408.1 FUSC family protein [Arthrobacter sp. H35-D1]
MTTTTRIRHSGTALAHAASATTWRNSMRLRPADAVFVPSMKVGITATVVLVAGGLTGQQHLVGLAALGALVSAFGRYQPYGRLARQLAMVAVSLLVATGVGALMGAAGVAPWLAMVVLSLIAGLASHIFHAFKITGPGAVILVFAASAGTSTAHSFADVGPVLLAVFLGALVGWLVALAPVLFFPMGPARLATARAVGAVVRWGGHPGTATEATGLRGSGSRDAGLREAALRAVDTARDSVAISATSQVPGKKRAAVLARHAHALELLLAEASAVLGTAAPSAESLERLARHEATLRKVRGLAKTSPGRQSHPAPVRPRLFPTARTALLSRDSLSQALRMAAASALAGWAAVVLGLEHPLWASMGAVAALQGLNYSITVQRSIQRLVGNVLGAVVALALLSMPLGFWPAVAMVIVFQVLAELLVMTNYTLTTIVVTPMALIMTGLGTQLAPEAAFVRVGDTLVGVVIGILVAALSISLSDRHHLGARA